MDGHAENFANLFLGAGAPRFLHGGKDSVFGVANRENKTTMESFGKQRVFDGQEMQAHIKIGKSRAQDKTIRIHFLFDKQSERFKIGYCGRHLPTSGRTT